MKPELKKEVEKVTNVQREPDTEESPIIQNKITRKNSKNEYSTYRITIPKKFAKKINIDITKQKFIFKLLNEGTPNSPSYKLTAELVEK